MKKSNLKRVLAFALALCMCLPLITVPTFAAWTNGDTLDFESYTAGNSIVAGGAIKTVGLKKTLVMKEGENTFLRIPFVGAGGNSEKNFNTLLANYNSQYGTNKTLTWNEATANRNLDGTIFFNHTASTAGGTWVMELDVWRNKYDTENGATLGYNRRLQIGAQCSGGWMEFCYVDIASGAVGTPANDGSRSGVPGLKENAWNKVKVVYQGSTTNAGTLYVYVNDALYLVDTSPTRGAANVEVKANSAYVKVQWPLSSSNTTANNSCYLITPAEIAAAAENNYEGVNSVDIDNVHVYTTAAETPVFYQNDFSTETAVPGTLLASSGLVDAKIENEKYIAPFFYESSGTDNNDNNFAIRTPNISATMTSHLAIETSYTFANAHSNDFVELRVNGASFDSTTFYSAKVTRYEEGSDTGIEGKISKTITSCSFLEFAEVGATYVKYMDHKGNWSYKGINTYDGTQGVSVKILVDLENGVFASYVNGKLDYVGPAYAQASVGSIYTSVKNRDDGKSTNVWAFNQVTNLTLNGGKIVYNFRSSAARSTPDRTCAIDDIKYYGVNGLDLSGVIASNDFDAITSSTLPFRSSKPSSLKPVANGAGQAVQIDFAKGEGGVWNVNNKWEDGVNIDKQARIDGFGAHYLLTPTVTLEADYYVAPGSIGRFESQIYQGVSNDTGTHVDKNYIALYEINAGNATISVNGKTVAFPQDQWNTVTVVFDLVAGKLDVYLNNVYVNSSSVGVGRLFIAPDQWIIGKVMKVSSAVPEADLDDPEKLAKHLKGYFRIDNAKMTVPTGTEAQDVTLGNNGLYATVDNGSVETLVTSNTKVWKDSDAVTVTNAEMTPNAIPATQDLGSVRVHDALGLRFISKIDADALAAIGALGGVSKVEIGTLITMADYIGAEKASAVTFEALQAYQTAAGFTTYVDVKGTEGAWYTGTTGTTLGDGTYFAGSIVGIKQGHLDQDMIGRAYVRVTLADGSSKIFYSATECTRSVAYVASMALADNTVAWNDDQKTKLESLIPSGYELPEAQGSLQAAFSTGTEYFFA